MTNITETVEEDKPSIITSVQTEPVTFADCHFLEDAVHNTERVTGQLVKNVYADGAYQSPDNREFAMLHMGMELLTSKLQGGCKYVLDREPGTDNLKVTIVETGEVIDAVYVGESKCEGKRWRINLPKDKFKFPRRYFNEEEVRRSELRRKIESLPIEEQNKRHRGCHVPVQIPHTQRENTIQRPVQTSPPGFPSLHVDESAQIGAIPGNNKPKTAYGSGISPHRRGLQPYIQPHRGHFRPREGLPRIFNALGGNICSISFEAQIFCFRADV